MAKNDTKLPENGKGKTRKNSKKIVGNFQSKLPKIFQKIPEKMQEKKRRDKKNSKNTRKFQVELKI